MYWYWKQDSYNKQRQSAIRCVFILALSSTYDVTVAWQCGQVVLWGSDPNAGLDWIITFVGAWGGDEFPVGILRNE